MARSGDKVLVVGGGRAGSVSVWDAETKAWYELSAMPRHPRGRCVTLNLDLDARPDVVGDINKAPFASQAFARVYFENVEWASFTGDNLGAINESARLLRDGGQLIVATGSGVRPHLDAIKHRMRESGFQFVRITELKYGRIRVSGRRRELS
jgi:SAM-dependent methyltransferase